MKKTRNWVGALFTWFFKLFPIKKNRIYFIARYGQQYSCNPRAYFEYLYQNHKDEFEFVWCLNDKKIKLPDDVKRTKFMSLRDQYYLHTSKYIVNNLRFCMLFSKRKKQVYIQTWHGGPIMYKKFEKDQKLSFFNEWNSKIDSEQIDILCCGSTQAKKVLDNNFFCDNKTFMTGNPRCDKLVNKSIEEKRKILQQLNLNEDDYIVLYAPTFRNNQKIEDSVLDNEHLKRIFQEKINKNVKILYRFHPKIAKQSKKLKLDDFVQNVTFYPDIQDLLLVADVLITDYSSCMFDMMIAHKLCIIYTNNDKLYLSQERGVYFPTASLPFPVANSVDKLYEIIENIDIYEKDNDEKVNKFLDNFGVIEDGNSCERLYKLMKELKNE